MYSNDPQGMPLPESAPPVALPQRPKHVYTAAEKWLIPVAFLAALLFDRLVLAPQYGQWLAWNGHAIFWLALTAVFCVLNREKLKKNPVAWLVGGLCVSLGVWFFLFGPSPNIEYATLTMLALPFALMGFAQFVWGGFSLKEPGGLALAWVLGFLIRPFSALGRCFGAAASALRWGGKGRGVRILIGCVCAGAILVWLVGMMREADMVFEYYVNQILWGFEVERFCFHAGFVAVFGLLLYSFLWNSRFAVRQTVVWPEVRLDAIVCAIVLCAVLAAYTVFAAVQFTFLFGRLGLPAGLTYAQYAVSGFWQVVWMAMFNLGLFGAMLRFGPAATWLRPVLGGLVVATGVMLGSAAVRLSMYIGAYGMTWLRLISAWFLIYLAAVLALCVVRLIWEKLPLMAVGGIVLLFWYAALGYANPQGIIALFAR